MCDHTNDPGGREAAMTIIERDENGIPTVWCDPCIASIVAALNAAGLQTIASCCGHGRNDPSIDLADGRSLVIAAEAPVAYEHRKQGEPSDAQVHSAWLAVNGAITQTQMRAALRAAGGGR